MNPKTRYRLIQFPWLALIQFGFVVVFYMRPFIAHMYPSYSAFNDMLPLKWWMWWALVNTLMIGLPYWPDIVRAYVRLVGWLSFALFMMAVATVFAIGIGLNTGSWTYTVLAGQGFIQFGRRSNSILSRCRWFASLKRNPPGWFPSREVGNGQ